MIRRRDLMTRGEVRTAIREVCAAAHVAAPSVRFDLPHEWTDDGLRIEGRYFVAERLIRFPDSPLHDIESVAHEVAHHLLHRHLLAGGDGHDAEHAAKTLEVQDWIDRRRWGS